MHKSVLSYPAIVGRLLAIGHHGAWHELGLAALDGVLDWIRVFQLLRDVRVGSGALAQDVACGWLAFERRIGHGGLLGLRGLLSDQVRREVVNPWRLASLVVEIE